MTFHYVTRFLNFDYLVRDLYELISIHPIQNPSKHRTIKTRRTVYHVLAVSEDKMYFEKDKIIQKHININN